MIKFILFVLINSITYAFSSTNILFIDTGIDLSHDYIKKYNIKQSVNKIENDHGTHLFCIVFKDINPKKYIITSINYKKESLDSIYKKLKDISFSYVLYASGGDKYQKKEEELIDKIIKNNKNVKIITSSGNNKKNLDSIKYFPCSYDKENITCIGNFQEYSNYGSKVLKIKSPLNFESCSLNNSFSIKKGTSQTAAFYLNKLLRK